MSDQNDDVRGGYPVGDRQPGRNGSSPDEHSALPIDLAAVQADDELIDALGRIGPVQGPDAQLTQVLLAWRRDVRGDDDGDPGEPLVDVDTALAVVARAKRPAPRRSMLTPFAAAAAMAVIAFSGLGLGAKAAEPGDTLFPVKRVLYTEQARSEEAAVEVRTKLAEANDALREGRPAEAEGKLQQVDEELPAVDEQEGRADLAAQRNALKFQLGGRDTGTTPPAADTSVSPIPPQQVGSSAAAEPSTPPETPVDPGTPTPSPEPEPEPSTPAEPGAGTGGPGPGGGAGGSGGGAGDSGAGTPTPRSDTAPEGEAPAPADTPPAG